VKRKAIAQRPASPPRDSFVSRLNRLLVVLFIIPSLALPAAAQSNPKKVLILNSFSYRGGYEGIKVLESKVRAACAWPVDFNVEFLGGRRLDEKGYEEALVATLRRTYAEEGLDLVLIQSYTGLQFAVRHRDEIFPGVPIIFLDVDPGQLMGQHMWPGVTGVTAEQGIPKTVDLALHLHPDAESVAVISSNSTPDRYFLSRIHAELLRHQNRVKEIDLFALPTTQLMEKLAELPQQTIIFFQLAREDSVQPAIDTDDILEWIAQRRPTYSIFQSDIMNHGGIGGADYDSEAEFPLVTEQAKRVLSGERPENIPVASYSGAHAFVDWRQLQRWHIPESALPPGTIVLYREPTLWERGRKYFLIGIAVIILQGLLIFGLLWQRARKRRAEAVLRESEMRFRVMANTTPALIWMCDQQGKITYLNDERLDFTGPIRETGYSDGWIEYVHPDDIKRVLETLARGLESQERFSHEYRLRRRDGVYRWMFDVASPRFNGDGTFAGFIGSAIDVTDQKLAREALETVSGRLIEAQEKERTRIARELHDDICQKLAVLSMEIQRANRGLDGSAGGAKEQFEKIRTECAAIAGDVQLLSHELHSSKLEYLGVAAAIRGFCKELAKQHELNIEFTEQNVPKQLPREVSLCLFRVAQEALHNALKHSGTVRFWVNLTGTMSEVQLEVRDEGAGFDVEEAKQDRGLGLVSMQERMNLVHGRFQIESVRGAGTKVVATSPLTTITEEDSVRTADDGTRNMMGAA
jgi:PAS domain S-box-containing protein